MIPIIIEDLQYSKVLKVFFVILIATWLVWLWSRRRFYILSWKLPGPLSLPIIGNALQLGIFGRSLDLINVFKVKFSTYPSPFCFWAGPDFCVVVTEAEDLEVILLSKATYYKDKRYDIFLPVIGPGLLSSSGPYWKMHRQMLNPAFRNASIRSHQSIYNKHALILINNLLEVRNQGSIDVDMYNKRFGADTIGEALFDTEMNFHNGKNDYTLNLIATLAESVYSRMTKFWQEYDFIYHLSEDYKITRDTVIDYGIFFHKLMKQKLADFKPDTNRKDKSVFQILADAFNNNIITERELLWEFDNIFNPGVETSSAQLSWFMLIMGMHKESQDKLWNEIREFYHDDLHREVQWEDLNQLPYLDMCIKELIRLFPTGPILIRRVIEDLEFKKKNITIPAGSMVVFSLFLMHRNSKYWDDPDAFVPERFGPECTKKRPHFAFLPFSAGMRNCVAQNFALDMLKTVAINLIRNLEFHSNLTMQDLSIKSDVSVKSTIGYNVTIQRR